MGLLGLGLAWARQPFDIAQDISGLLIVAGALVLMLVVGAYALKCLRSPHAAVEDWRDPVRANFFAGVSISLMLVPAGLSGLASSAAAALWVGGALLHLGLALALLSRWLTQAQDLRSLTPAWFLPVVGMIVAPFAGAEVGFDAFASLLLAAGLAMWVVLLPVVFARLIFMGPLPGPSRPALFILITPPALAATAIAASTPASWAAMPLFHVALFFAVAVVLATLREMRVLLAEGFSLAWWATTFPLAALASAASVASGPTGIMAHTLLAVATATVAAIAAMTLRLALHRVLMR